MEREPTKTREADAPEGDLDDRMTALWRNKHSGVAIIEHIRETEPGTVAVRFALPHGDDHFTRAFVTPDAPTSAAGRPLTHLLEVLDVPLDEVDRLEHHEVPVKWTGDGWRLAIPDHNDDGLLERLKDVDYTDDNVIAGGGLIAATVLLALLGSMLTTGAVQVLIPVIVTIALATGTLMAIDELTGINEVDRRSGGDMNTRIEADDIAVDIEGSNTDIDIEMGDGGLNVSIESDRHD